MGLQVDETLWHDLDSFDLDHSYVVDEYRYPMISMLLYVMYEIN